MKEGSVEMTRETYNERLVTELEEKYGMPRTVAEYLISDFDLTVEKYYANAISWKQSAVAILGTALFEEYLESRYGKKVQDTPGA